MFSHTSPLHAQQKHRNLHKKMKVSESEPSAAAGRHGSQACAACKYQRRKCKPDCSLAPFFPSRDKERFRNVHKLFGVANVTKILQEIPPSFREIAMKCIIYESSARAIAPVGGLGEVGLGLERLIAVHMAELEAVRGQLEAFRAMERANGEGVVMRQRSVKRRRLCVVGSRVWTSVKV